MSNVTLFARLLDDNNTTIVNINDYQEMEIYGVLEIIETIIRMEYELEPKQTSLMKSMYYKYESVFNKIYNETNHKDIKEYILEQSCYLDFNIVDNNKRQTIMKVIDLLQNLIELMDKPTRLNELVDLLQDETVEEQYVVETYKFLENLQIIVNSAKIEEYIEVLKRTSNK